MALRGPIGVPVVTVQHRAEAGHAVAPADSPSGAGLFHPPTNHVFTRPFDLPTADCSSLGQPLRIIQTPPMLAHILLQPMQGLLPLVIARRGCNNIVVFGVMGMGCLRLLAAVQQSGMVGLVRIFARMFSGEMERLC